MKLNNVSSINFKSITPIIAKNGYLSKINDHLNYSCKADSFELINVTDTYSNSSKEDKDIYEKAIDDDCEVGLLISGDELYNDIDTDNILTQKDNDIKQNVVVLNENDLSDANYELSEMVNNEKASSDFRMLIQAFLFGLLVD